MEGWERETAPLGSIEEMTEDIKRIPSYKKTEVLCPAALVKHRKKLPPTCKSHIEQPIVLDHASAPLTAPGVTFQPHFACWLCGNYEHVGKDRPESMHGSNSLRKCTNCQVTGYYSILWTKRPNAHPSNTLNASQCDFCFGHHYGSECNKKKPCTSVRYSNRTKQAIRIWHNKSPMPEGSNHQTVILHNGCMVQLP